MATLSYHEQKNIENTKKLRELQKELPYFCTDFFRGIEASTSVRTRIAYAHDLKIFFQFLKTANPRTFDNPAHTLTPGDLEKLTVSDLEEYIDYLKCHPSDTCEDVVNTERGLMRKVSSLRSFYSYFFRNELIEKNPAALVRMQKLYHERTKVRDLAMMSLLLGTGIRVSECVGLNINDIDLDTCGARVYRKGGKESVIYFSDEVRDVLEDYLDEREMIDAVPGNEDALFLSMQRKRINVRSVENLVKKYAKLVTPLKKITPHKLRSTYGTSLYRETGDIYLVASVLGHNDVNTTRKHYAAQEEERRRSARNVVRLRES